MTETDPTPPVPDPVEAHDVAAARGDAPAGPGPRAFAQGTGWVLQSLGILLLLINCCACSLAGLWEESLQEESSLLVTTPPEPLTLSELAQEPGKAGVMIMVFGCTAGGLALAAFGVGMQSEKPKSAWGAVVSCAALLVVLTIAAVGLWAGEAGVLARGWNALMIVLLATALGFCIAALREMRRHPPDPNLHVLPADFEIPPDPLGPHGKRRKRY